jgi:hypothetical protein
MTQDDKFKLFSNTQLTDITKSQHPAQNVIASI